MSVVKVMIVPFGEYTRRLIGMGEMPLLAPVTLSVSASISCRTSSKFVNFLPLQCRNSAYSRTVDGRRGEKEMGRWKIRKRTKRTNKNKEVHLIN